MKKTNNTNLTQKSETMLTAINVTKTVVFDYGEKKTMTIKKFSDGRYQSFKGEIFTFRELQESAHGGVDNKDRKLPFTPEWKVRKNPEMIKGYKFDELLEMWKKVFEEK